MEICIRHLSYLDRHKPRNGEIMESLIGPIIGLVTGAIGGNVAGKVMNSDMGTMGRSITGIVGGGGLAFLAPMIPGLDGLLGGTSESLDPMAIIGSVVSGGLRGAILTFILGKVMGGK